METDTGQATDAGAFAHAGETKALPAASDPASGAEMIASALATLYGPLTWREKVAYLGVALKTLVQVNTPVEHFTNRQIYIRTMRIPANTCFIGRAHRVGHQVSLTEGSVLLIGERGKREFHAPKTLVTQAGTVLVVYTLTDIECITVHPNPTNSTDWAALEDEIFEPVAAMEQLGRDVAARLLS